MEKVEETTNIIVSLSTLSSTQLSDLTHSIFSTTNHHHTRLSAVLSSATLFSATLHHLYSLPLHHKSLLIARHLLSSLHRLTRYFHPTITSYPPTIKPRDLDAVLLLLLLSEFRRHHPEALQTTRKEWRVVLTNYWTYNALTLSSIGVYNGATLIPYIEMVTRCWRFIGAIGFGGGKAEREVAASAAAVIGLPSVESSGGGEECVICREEMSEGRDVCELPCRHLFHWICILRWLRKRSTCPCCRFQLPSDDVFAEIRRLWSVLMKNSGDCP